MDIPGFHARIAHDSVPWHGTRYPGVFWLRLHREDAARPQPAGSDETVLIRMDPGCGYPAHRHVGVEEVLVLQGEYHDDRGAHRSGAYVRYDAGSVHAPVAGGDATRPMSAANPPCILFAIARGGVEHLDVAERSAGT